MKTSSSSSNVSDAYGKRKKKNKLLITKIFCHFFLAAKLIVKLFTLDDFKKGIFSVGNKIIIIIKIVWMISFLSCFFLHFLNVFWLIIKCFFSPNTRTWHYHSKWKFSVFFESWKKRKNFPIFKSNKIEKKYGKWFARTNEKNRNNFTENISFINHYVFFLSSFGFDDDISLNVFDYRLFTFLKTFFFAFWFQQNWENDCNEFMTKFEINLFFSTIFFQKIDFHSSICRFRLFWKFENFQFLDST